MTQFKGIKSTVAGLESVGILDTGLQNWNLSPAELVEETLKREQGVLADNGGLCVKTGKFTGRSPKDKFAVFDGFRLNSCCRCSSSPSVDIVGDTCLYPASFAES